MVAAGFQTHLRQFDIFFELGSQTPKAIGSIIAGNIVGNIAGRQYCRVPI